MKITISYQDHELQLVADVVAALKALFPFMRRHESNAQPGYKLTYLTIRNPEKSR